MRGMAKYLCKRLISVVFTLLILSVFIFSIIHLTPGDPARTMLGSDATQESVDALRTQLGLDRPLVQQYISWVGNALQGNLGQSYFRNEPVLAAIGEHLGPTLALSVWAQLLATLIAIPAGIIAAKHRGKAIDSTVIACSLIGISLPSFLLSMFLVIIFGINLGWLPPSGYKDLSAGLGQHLRYIVLPVVALACMQAALLTRMTRSSMIDVINTDYIKTARAKGVKERIIFGKHAFRNALNPILTTIGQSFGTLISGAAVIETVFNIPGIGQLVVNSVLKRDYPVIQGVVLVASLIYVVINLAVDLLYGVVDPRVRVTGKAK